MTKSQHLMKYARAIGRVQRIRAPLDAEVLKITPGAATIPEWAREPWIRCERLIDKLGAKMMVIAREPAA